MSQHRCHCEALILDVLRSTEALTLEQAAATLPALSWCELFHAVDALSRQGELVLMRRGVIYELRARYASPEPPASRQAWTHCSGNAMGPQQKRS